MQKTNENEQNQPHRAPTTTGGGRGAPLTRGPQRATTAEQKTSKIIKNTKK